MNKVTSFLNDLIFKGKISGLKYIKLILSLVPLIALFGILFDHQLEKDFAKYGWHILIATLLIRPISTILPKLVILCRFMLIRKQLGIIAGTFILAHGLGVFLKNQMGIDVLFSAPLWDLKTFMGWGLIGALMILPPLLTSNDFLQRKLGKLWKSIQQISYLFFIFGGVHIYMYKNDPVILAELITWAILWILAWRKIILWAPAKNEKTPTSCS